MFVFRKFSGLIMASMLLIAVLGCERDSPNPINDNNSENSSTGLTTHFDYGPNTHDAPGPYCGSVGTAPLVTEAGSPTITYCPGGPCTGLQSPWGTATYTSGIGPNGDNVIEFQADMAPGWAVVGAEIQIGNTHDFQTSSGVPINTGDWKETSTPPVEDFAWNVPIGNNPECIMFAAKFTVCKYGFLTGIDPNSYTDVWIQNPNFSTTGISPSSFITAYCAPRCGSLVTPMPNCEAIPSLPNPSCTQSPSLNEVEVKAASDVVCIGASGNMGNVHFSKAGTMVIEQGQVVSGGIMANKGGRLIVKGEFNWTGNANIGKDFEIFVAPGGKISRVGSFNFNQARNRLVNYGRFNCEQNLVFKGEVYNAGVIEVQGINANSITAKLVNVGVVKLSHTMNLNNGATLDNCGSVLIKGNLHINAGAQLNNKSLVWVKGSGHNNGTLHNYDRILINSGNESSNGNNCGLFLQGQTHLYDNSLILSPRLSWLPNRVVEVTGNASLLVAEYSLDANKEITNLFGNGRLKIQSGVQLNGTGNLRIVDIDPLGLGDIPSGNNFPSDVLNQIHTGPDASIHITQMDPIIELPSWNGSGI